MNIEIDGNEIRVSLQTSERARKTLEIEFRSKDELVVTLPRGQDVDTEAVLRKHKALIERKYRSFLSRIHILDDDTILYQGKRYKIQLQETGAPSEEKVNIHVDVLTLHTNDIENPLKVLKGWISERTQKLIDRVLMEHPELTRPKRVFITDTKRWGYARKNGEIVFNWQLSALPPELGEYIIVHELVHLEYMNHRRSFHSRMIKLIPDYKEKEKKLKKYLAIDPKFENKHSG